MRRLRGRLRCAAQAAGRREHGADRRQCAQAAVVDGLPAALRGKTLEFFPETGEVIDTAALASGRRPGKATPGRRNVPLVDAAQRRAPRSCRWCWPAGDAGLAHAERQGAVGQWPTVAAAAGVSPALRGSAAQQCRAPLPRHRLTFVAALLGALLGGLLLNLMPCVFPVLAIKVVGFTRHADDRRGHRLSGAGLHRRRDGLLRWPWAR